MKLKKEKVMGIYNIIATQIARRTVDIDNLTFIVVLLFFACICFFIFLIIKKKLKLCFGNLFTLT